MHADNLKHDISTANPTSTIPKLYKRVFQHVPEHIVIPLLYVTGLLADTVTTVIYTQSAEVIEANPVTATALNAFGVSGIIATKIIGTIIIFVIIRFVLPPFKRLTWYYIVTATLGLLWILLGIWNTVLITTIQ